jgi:hypothetical protein
MMKKALILFTTLFMLILTVHGDICIVEKTHTDAYYYGGVPTPASDTTSKTWISKDKMAYMTPNRQVIIDTQKSLITIVNLRDKSYVQTHLPIDMSKIVPEQLLSMLKNYLTQGTVKATGEKKKIKQWSCQGYDIKVAAPTPMEIKVWATTDVPLDWGKYNNVLNNIRKLGNYSPEYIEALKNMKGVGIETDVTVFLQGSTIKSVSKVTEISSKTPPEDTYLIPADCKKKDQLSLQDIRNR